MTDVPEELPDAPQGVSASLSGEPFTISWSAVSGADLYRVEHRAAGASAWTSLPSTASTTQEFAPDVCGTTYEFRVQAHGDGETRVAGWGTPSSAVQAATAACRPTLSAVSDSVFVGEEVTLTAQSQGSVSHYQWQEWANGAWTNLGAASASNTRAVTSSVAAVSFYRVVATYSSGATGESEPVAVAWKAISLGVSASPEYPESADAAKRTVTLTAGGDVPSGARYQWQEDTGTGAWTNLGAASTSPTKQVSSTARGTRKFRVAVTHAGVTAHSEPVYVTWDEWAIVADVIGDLSSAAASSTAYTEAQTALLTCMNATGSGAVGDSGPSGQAPTPPPAVTFGSFDDILSRYTGAVKARMEAGGDCAATSTTMFDTNQSVTRAELARLKAGSSAKAVLYAGWLSTPQGQHFEANLGDPDELKFVSYLGATTFEPGQFTRPLYSSASGEEGASGQDAPKPTDLPVLGTGLGCLPNNVDGEDLSLANKIVVLNCLVFSTPHDFWVEQSLKTIDNNALKASGRFDWLGYEHWDCTRWFDGPLPSCLKHDVALASLKKFVGGTEEDTLDESWNPRNKLLVDPNFLIDIGVNGCQNPTFGASSLLWCQIYEWLQALTMYAGVAWYNNKDWVYTRYDLEHINERLGFAEYHIPSVNNVSVSSSPSRLPHLTVYRVDWMYNPGTVSTASASHFRICWQQSRGDDLCREVDGNDSDYELVVLGVLDSLKSIEVEPSRRVWVGTRPFASSYYPPAIVNLTYGD